ncbi:MAG: 4Fe-4S dicluster domain-containing protein [bacterium]|nr:4Fe-4S dicluster domain-containing protein [bacterium]
MKAILVDTTKCVGCEECVDACILKNNLKTSLPWRWISNDGLSSERFSAIIRKSDDHFIKKQCRHCIEPACVSSCPVGALEKTEVGAVIYDADKCMGCRYCMMACPYGIPRYSWEEKIPYVRKCDMCYDLVRSGETPACVEACPENAAIFGDRDDLIIEAKRRFETEPDRYVKSLYGEFEAGGTSVMYISDIELDFLGWKNNTGNNALPSLTKFAMNAVPPVFLGVGAAMFGIYKLTERREKVRQQLEKTGSDQEKNPLGEENES